MSRIEQKWETHLDDFLRQEELMEDYLSPFEDLINNAENDIEKHTIMWCVENLIPLNQLRKDQFISCTYEYLVRNNIEEIGRIFGMLGLKVPSNIRKIFFKLSKLSNPLKSNLSEINRLTYWKSKLERDEMASILKLVNAFEIDIYNDDPMPILDCAFLK